MLNQKASRCQSWPGSPGPLLMSTMFPVLVGGEALPIKKGALVFVTLGAKGAPVYHNGAKLADAAGFDVKTVETTGCGDCFMAAVLAAAAGSTIDELAEVEPNALHSVMRFANAAAAIVATPGGCCRSKSEAAGSGAGLS